MSKKPDTRLRQEILRAALKLFAERGYAGTSIQDIVDQTNGSKPSVYYHFKNKEALYEALLAQAFDEGLALMQKAAARSRVLEEQLVEILDSHFDFLKQNPDLVRLAFAAAFASPGELPRRVADSGRGRRNFEFVHSLIQSGLDSGKLEGNFDSAELANGIYGALCYQLMLATVRKDIRLNRRVAQRIVRLFFQGARPQPVDQRRRPPSRVRTAA